MRDKWHNFSQMRTTYSIIDKIELLSIISMNVFNRVFIPIFTTPMTNMTNLEYLLLIVRKQLVFA